MVDSKKPNESQPRIRSILGGATNFVRKNPVVWIIVIPISYIIIDLEHHVCQNATSIIGKVICGMSEGLGCKPGYNCLPKF
jgi:hypothetical protein